MPARSTASASCFFAWSLAAVAGLTLALPQAAVAKISLPPGVPPTVIPKRNTPSAPPRRNNPQTGADIKPGEPWADSLITKSSEQQYTATVEVTLKSLRSLDSRGFPSGPPLKFETAVVVFPVIESTAGSRFIESGFKGEFTFNGEKVDITPKFIKNYHSGTQLARWEARGKEGNDLLLHIDVPMACWNIRIDESLAREIPWPKNGAFPEVAASTFKPQLFVDYIFRESEKTASDKYFKQLTAEWLDNEDPKKRPPYEIAKVLLGRVVENFQINGDGLAFTRDGSFEGFSSKGALLAMQDGRGSQHDMATILAAVYRAAGLPARTVVGIDVAEESKIARSNATSRRKLHSWVEYCLIDPGNGKEIWLPADPERLRRNSSRPPRLEQEWKYFTYHEDLAAFIPLAFQYHPPTTVVAHGSPALWGWLTTPNIQNAEQSIRFYVNSRARRSGDDSSTKPR
ncbi:hypothetical protein BH11PLA1_BH11PLA1_04100 [soil metagenome]